MNFDPITGQPINNSIVSNQGQQINVQPTQVQTPQQVQQPVPTVEPVQPVPTPTIESVQPVPTVNNTISTQQQIQTIPTVEQSKQEFINNTQANNTVKKEEKNDGPNIGFIVILFVIIFAAIFFLFPYLLKVL